MSGWSADEFCANRPSDGVVDRLHIHHYPRGLGEQELHADPPARQKFIQGFNLTTLGQDYYSGGLYFIQSDNGKVFVDEHLTKGDGYIAYPTVIHGVEKIDCQSAPDWSRAKGAGSWDSIQWTQTFPKTGTAAGREALMSFVSRGQFD